MSYEMVERVARAIYDAENGIDGDQIADMLVEDFRIYGTADECREMTMEVCRQAARAALVAIGIKRDALGEYRDTPEPPP
jgi:3-oxoacyl-[acyl-carrier-protein] synthase III